MSDQAMDEWTDRLKMVERIEENLDTCVGTSMGPDINVIKTLNRISLSQTTPQILTVNGQRAEVVDRVLVMVVEGHLQPFYTIYGQSNQFMTNCEGNVSQFVFDNTLWIQSVGHNQQTVGVHRWSHDPHHNGSVRCGQSR